MRLTLVALPEKEVVLVLGPDGQVYARAVINGRVCKMQRVFVHAIDRWVGTPKVEFVELWGVDVATGEEVVERMIPK